MSASPKPKKVAKEGKRKREPEDEAEPAEITYEYVAGENSIDADKMIMNFVPLLVIIFEHIDDFNIKKQITKFYMQHIRRSINSK